MIIKSASLNPSKCVSTANNEQAKQIRKIIESTFTTLFFLDLKPSRNTPGLPFRLRHSGKRLFLLPWIQPGFLGPAEYAGLFWWIFSLEIFVNNFNRGEIMAFRSRYAVLVRSVITRINNPFVSIWISKPIAIHNLCNRCF